jgi:hypothetical protein
MIDFIYDPNLNPLDAIYKPHFYRWAKKSKNRLNRDNRKKIIEKTEPWKKRLEKLKKNSVRFGFGFKRLKPNNLTESVQIEKINQRYYK